MTNCSAFGCNNRRRKKSKQQLLAEETEVITFHRFSVNKGRRIAWIAAIRRDNWLPTKYSRICSAHFSKECFDVSYTPVRLREDAVPTIFEGFPSHLQKVRKTRRSLSYKNEALVASADVSNDVEDVEALEESSVMTLEIPVGVNNASTSGSPSLSECHVEEKDVSKSHVKCCRKLKILQQKTRRQKRRIASLKSVISEIRKSNLLSEEKVITLAEIAGPSKDLLLLQVRREKGLPLTRKYNAKLRSFALTLHFYSPRAYVFVRDAFNSSLPHPKTLTKWYKSIDGAPGFTSEAFNSIKVRASSSTSKIYCALMLDEMAIREQLDFDGTKYHGYVDMGTGIEGDHLDMARDVLVLMLVAINAKWKVPVGYFLINGIDGNQKANLVTQCLRLAEEAGVQVLSVTFDGAPSNFTMARKVGCVTDVENMMSSFPHPVTADNVYIFPDACHLIKLVRNTLGEKRSLFHEGNEISWKYVEALNELQEGEGLQLCNKLKPRHILFHREKMKVRTATEVLSNSVAKSLEICENDLKLRNFKGSETTRDFIDIFNDIFDIFNSKTLQQTGFKKALHADNQKDVFQKLERGWEYIRNLKIASANGQVVPIIESPRKVGFLGFLICMKSLKGLYEDACLKKRLSNLPTYRLSQDHLELFFGCVRAHGGNNNNPNARQFMSAYKKLLINSSIGCTPGNCVPLENIAILHCSSGLNPVDIINGTTDQGRNMTCNETGAIHDDHSYILDPQSTSEFTDMVVTHIAGNVVHHLAESIKCGHCVDALIGEWNPSHVLLERNGKIPIPSNEVVSICRKSEKVIKFCLAENGGTILQNKYTSPRLTEMVMETYVGGGSAVPIFPYLLDHSHGQSPMERHSIHLLKAVAMKYIKIRMLQISRRSNAGQSVCHFFNKMVLFRRQ